MNQIEKAIYSQKWNRELKDLVYTLYCYNMPLDDLIKIVNYVKEEGHN